MKAQDTYILFPSSANDWRVARVAAGVCTLTPIPGTAGDELANNGQLISRALVEIGYNGSSVCVAIPSDWCLCAPINTNDLPQRNRRSLMIYRLEEKLPIPAEDLVVDFAPGMNCSLGVASKLDRLRPLVDSLEAAGVAVSSISPAAVLSLQQIVSDGTKPDVHVHVVEGSIEVFSFSDGKIASWRYLHGSVELEQEIRRQQLRLGTPLRINICGLDTQMTESLRRLSVTAELSVTNGQSAEFASLAADRVLRGRSEAWVELRRDALAVKDALRQIRAPLSAAIAALVAVCICFAGAMLWKAHGYDQLAEALQKQQANAFREALPGSPLPANMKSRLASEEKKLRGVSGAAGELPSRLSALNQMYDVLRSLPRDLRYRVLEMRFAGERLYLEGQSRTHGDAEVVAESLRKTGLLQVDAPQSEQRADNSVAFSLSAVAKPSGAIKGATQ